MDIKLWLVKRRLAKEGYELLEVSERALEMYRNVGDNASLDDVTLTLKLNRNYILGKDKFISIKETEMAYGNLNIVRDVETNTIVRVYNHKGRCRSWAMPDKELREKLNELMGLNKLEKIA